MEGYIPLTGDDPAEEHADDQPATAEDDMHGHWYTVRKGSIVEERRQVEQGDLE